MIIGGWDFSEKLKSLTFAEFKKFWKAGDYERKTGLTVELAAKKFEIKNRVKPEAKGE